MLTDFHSPELDEMVVRSMALWSGDSPPENRGRVTPLPRINRDTGRKSSNSSSAEMSSEEENEDEPNQSLNGKSGILLYTYQNFT